MEHVLIPASQVIKERVRLIRCTDTIKSSCSSGAVGGGGGGGGGRGENLVVA